MAEAQEPAQLQSLCIEEMGQGECSRVRDPAGEPAHESEEVHSGLGVTFLYTDTPQSLALVPVWKAMRSTQG